MCSADLGLHGTLRVLLTKEQTLLLSVVPLFCHPLSPLLQQRTSAVQCRTSNCIRCTFANFLFVSFPKDLHCREEAPSLSSLLGLRGTSVLWVNMENVTPSRCIDIHTYDLFDKTRDSCESCMWLFVTCYYIGAIWIFIKPFILFFLLMFLQKRKRKEKEDDTVSLSSFDLKVRARTASCLLIGWESSIAPLNMPSKQTLIPLHDSSMCHRQPAQHNPTLAQVSVWGNGNGKGESEPHCPPAWSPPSVKVDQYTCVSVQLQLLTFPFWPRTLNFKHTIQPQGPGAEQRVDFLSGFLAVHTTLNKSRHLFKYVLKVVVTKTGNSFLFQ